MTRALSMAAAGSALVLGTVAPASAATGAQAFLPAAGRTSTCAGEVSAQERLCRVASFSTAVEAGRQVVFVELTTEAYTADPADRDHKVYLSDVLCSAPVDAFLRGERGRLLVLKATLDGCDVALGTGPTGPYRWRAEGDLGTSEARTSVTPAKGAAAGPAQAGGTAEGTTYANSLFFGFTTPTGA
ncbi:hypothetical protein [Kineococcus sp. SYSU DK005]|uniref:hypothetical protein n=1 Tax=Kineococcus sp. SYSU DK005 TaxID=3383126 RepID=UPI003D7EECE6